MKVDRRLVLPWRNLVFPISLDPRVGDVHGARPAARCHPVVGDELRWLTFVQLLLLRPRAVASPPDKTNPGSAGLNDLDSTDFRGFGTCGALLAVSLVLNLTRHGARA